MDRAGNDAAQGPAAAYTCDVLKVMDYPFAVRLKLLVDPLQYRTARAMLPKDPSRASEQFRKWYSAHNHESSSTHVVPCL
eukprot:scaffold32812_cov24-Tisochrysis_lutea.AAC.5